MPPRITEVTLDKASTEAGLDVTKSEDGFTVTGLEEDGVTTATGTIAATDVDSPDGSAADEGSVLKYLIKITGKMACAMWARNPANTAI